MSETVRIICPIQMSVLLGSTIVAMKSLTKATVVPVVVHGTAKPPKTTSEKHVNRVTVMWGSSSEKRDPTADFAWAEIDNGTTTVLSPGKSSRPVMLRPSRRRRRRRLQFVVVPGSSRRSTDRARGVYLRVGRRDGGFDIYFFVFFFYRGRRPKVNHARRVR